MAKQIKPEPARERIERAAPENLVQVLTEGPKGQAEPRELTLSEAVGLLRQEDPAAEQIAALADQLGGAGIIQVRIERIGPQTYQRDDGEIVTVDCGYWKTLPLAALRGNPEEVICSALGGGEYTITVKDRGRYGWSGQIVIGGEPLPMRRGQGRGAGDRSGAGFGQLREMLACVRELQPAQPTAAPVDPLAQLTRAMEVQDAFSRRAMATVRQAAEIAGTMNPGGNDDDDGNGAGNAGQEDPVFGLIGKALDAFKGDSNISALVKGQMAAYAAGHVTPQALAVMIRTAGASGQGAQILNAAVNMAPEQLAGLIAGLSPESGSFWQSPAGIEKIAALKAALLGQAAPPRKIKAAKPAAAPDPASAPADSAPGEPAKGGA